MRTYQPKAKEIKREKHTIDATGQILGRLATRVAGLLMGKGKPDYAPQLEMGDFGYGSLPFILITSFV